MKNIEEMKKIWVIFPVCVLLIISIILPASFLSANSSNLIINGDFQTGDFTGWPQNKDATVASDGSGNYYLYSSGAEGWSGAAQYINISDPNFDVSYRIWPKGVYAPYSYYLIFFTVYLFAVPDGRGSSIGFVHDSYDTLTTYNDCWVSLQNKTKS